MQLRNALEAVRYGLCGSILAIAVVQGFMPAVDLNAVIPGAVGFVAAGLASLKGLTLV